MLEELIKEGFEDAKNAFFRPQIEGPDILKNERDTALLNWLNLRIGISPEFVKKLSQYEDEKTIIRGLSAHEFSHFMYYPNNLSMHLFLSHASSDLFKEHADAVFTTFVDFINDNILIGQDQMKEELKLTRKAGFESLIHNTNPLLQALKETLRININNLDPVNAAICLAYKRKARIDINFELSKYDKEIREDIETAVSELEKVIITSNLDYGLQKSQLYRWGNALLPLLKKYHPKSEDCLGNSQVNSKGNDNGGYEECLGKGSVCDSQDGDCAVGLGPESGPRIIKPEDIENLPNDARRKFEEGVKGLIKHLSKHLYQDIKKYYLGEDADNENSGTDSGIGSGFSDEKLADNETIEYYLNAAKQYGIYIRPKRQLSLSAVSIHFGRKDWKPTDPSVGIDLRFSGGKVLPGLTKTARNEVIPYPANKEIIPRLILYKDSSGSMPNPKTHKDYSTIAGAIIVLSYLKSGSEVKISTFDSETTELFSSRNADKLLARLCGYKGGGTAIDMERLKQDLESKQERLPLDLALDQDELKHNPFFRKYLSKNARITNLNTINKNNTTTDFYIITDGGIGNLQEVLTFLKSSPEYRPTIIHTGSFGLDVKGYDQKTSGVYDGIRILKAETNQDIIDLTRKSVKNNILNKYCTGGNLNA